MKQKNSHQKISNDIIGVPMVTTMMQARYPEALAKKLSEYCEAHDKNKSKVLIRALIQYLKSEGAIDAEDESFEPKKAQ